MIKCCFGCFCDDVSEGCFAASGGTPENHGKEVARLDHVTENFSLSYKVMLAEKTLKCLRAQAICEIHNEDIVAFYYLHVCVISIP